VRGGGRNTAYLGKGAADRHVCVCVPLTTSSQFGIGLACVLDPGESSVITSVGLGDPAKSGFRKVVQGDDRGGGWDLSVVICEVGGRSLILNSRSRLQNSEAESRLQNSEAEWAGINPAPTKTGVGEGFIPSQPNCHFIDKTPLWGFLQEAPQF
jgi:hypothetical protein